LATQAVVWFGRRDVRVVDWPEPDPPPAGWVTVAVTYCGLCGTDIEEWLRGPVNSPRRRPHPLTRRQAPLVLGHEFTGRVVACGAGVRDFHIGERVACDTLIYCGDCPECRDHRYNLCQNLGVLGLSADGGFAPLVNAPAASLRRVPDEVSDEAAALAEPLAVAIHAVRRARMELGASVLVTGGGTIGLFAISCALGSGAYPVWVYEPNPVRRRLAERLGAVALPADVREARRQIAHSTGGVDRALECSGARGALAFALGSLKRRGRLVLVGLQQRPWTYSPNHVLFRELEVAGSLSHVVDVDFSAALQLLATGRVVPDVWPLRVAPLRKAVSEGFEALATGQLVDVVKVLIDCQHP
jgi:(R,R)-butanediol dehydrogenase/meso-butanediol dehydrogenase/diacetyl reductase